MVDSPGILALRLVTRRFPGNYFTRNYFGIFQNRPDRLGGKAVFQFVHHARKFHRKVIGQNFEAYLQVDRVVYLHVGKFDSAWRPSRHHSARLIVVRNKPVQWP
jgi:hypothetical protein